jgi:para-aminobenzoate synthetase component 1
VHPRVISASLGRWVDPAFAYAALCGDSDAAFWLDSGPSATTGTSYLGIAESLTTEFDGPVLDWLRTQRHADAPDLPPGFHLGVVGWLGYELRAETMDTRGGRVSRYPDAAMLTVTRALAFDHATHEITLIALEDIEGFRAEVRAKLDAVSATSVTVGSATPLPLREVTWAYSDADYLGMIAECQAAIIEGDAYQLCLTTEASVSWDSTAPDPLALYLALRAFSPTHHGALLRAGAISLLSASPERFLSVSPEGVVTTSPIKGTRARGPTEVADSQLREDLVTSEKERAENLMIVDLMRNDIARVSKVGSVDVTSLMAVESYAQVHQLVSTVRGELVDGLTGIDAIEVCFPAGSMTGAPKRSASDLLDRIEHRTRGIYAGAFGYFGADGTIDLAMVIRSIVMDAAGATIGTGGGITALSVPAEELAEVRLKAAALLAVLGAG